MWLGSAELLSDAESVASEGDLPTAIDLERLIQCEIEFRAFALGARGDDIFEFANAAARFVDVFGDTRALDEDFSPRNVLGPDVLDFDVESIDFSTSGRIAVSITRLRCARTPGGQRDDLVIWTKAWQLTSAGWRIISSHASLVPQAHL